jgi:hypothetical protein
MTRSATTSCGASIACSKSAAVAHQYSGFWSGTGNPRCIYLQLMQHARTRKRRDRPICGKCACPLNHRVALGQTFGRRARKTSATRLAIISCTEETSAPPKPQPDSTVGWEREFILSFRVMPWPCRSNEHLLCQRTNRSMITQPWPTHSRAHGASCELPTAGSCRSAA